ncbi:MAG TPA: hypothetical protein VFQ38_09240 [Longimicrobiales bacterium]|nr:hypothetical protein [Longimicrobiales bacterium]
MPPGAERAFLAPLPLAWLEADERVLALLEGVGVTTCGELAALEREAVEVRFGVEGVAVWRLARGEDERRLFAPVPPERPNGSMEFLGYVVTDPERLVFTANALLGSICDRLRERGEHARRLRLVLSLGNGETWERSLRPARATASRAVWLRLVRGVLERLTVADAVAGVTLEVESVEAAAVRQGDLFDRGFATASAVEAAVLRLLETQGEVVVRPEVGRHPLVERRTRWVAATAEWESGGVEERGRAGSVSPAHPLSHSAAPDGAGEGGDPGLALRLLPEPRDVRVETVRRRGSAVPARFRDGAGWREVVTVAGPDRISGGQWEAAYAREYYRAVTAEGVMVWLFRDAVRDAWWLHGWWD